MQDAPHAACSLRHYLLRDRRIAPRLKADVVLAEEANQLYRESDYGDLISFEEDISKIAALILLIAESAGSLAELGAFAAVPSIRKRLAVLIQSEHEEAESFVRYGPLERLKSEDDRRLAAIPWILNKKSALIKQTAAPHVSDIVGFINEQLKRIPAEESWKSAEELQTFVLILWLLHLSHAMTITQLLSYTQAIRPAMTQKDLRNALFCMKLAGWVTKFRHLNCDYWCSTAMADPFSRYSFKEGVERDPIRRKADVADAIAKELKLSRQVRERVQEKKGAIP
ncbi:hypothetical protein EKN06_00575 [Croceicoccus ponticola]|uniref:Uncharacterized protein n=2 Tax=Croceicoccus ponticola TaxID=2217664 RepID=A0A437GZH1_9SPHN|nr:hypothetical protein EKN06_00575 [Croceicoccus ponticola]